MSDLEVMKEMLGRAGVYFEVTERNGTPDFPNTTRELKIPEDHVHPRNLWYYEFYTVMGFDKEEKLLWVGAWE